MEGIIVLLLGIVAGVIYFVKFRGKDDEEDDSKDSNNNGEENDNGGDNDNGEDNGNDNDDDFGGNDIDKDKKVVVYDLAEGQGEIVIPSIKQGEKLYTIAFTDGQNVRSIDSTDEVDPIHGDCYEDLKKLEFETLEKHEDVTSKIKNMVFPLSAVDYNIGDKETFWTMSDAGSDEFFVERKVRLRNKKDGVLIWADENADISNNDIKFLLDEFLDFRYDIIDYFGREPAVDDFPVLQKRGDVVNIVLASFEPGGYFHSADLYPSSTYSRSNEGRFLYVNPRFSNNLLAGIIAHEYQHLLYYNEKVISGRGGYSLWINEGFSELAMDIAGYGYKQGVRTGAVPSFLSRTKETSLVSWGSRLSDYGSSYLFARYLYDRFGKDIINAITTSSKRPKDAIKDFTGLKFWEMFKEWAVTLLAEDIGLDIGSEYSFGGSITIPAISKEIVLAYDEINNTDTLDWGISFTEVDFDEKDEVKIKLNDSYSDNNFRKIVVRTKGNQ